MITLTNACAPSAIFHASDSPLEQARKAGSLFDSSRKAFDLLACLTNLHAKGAETVQVTSGGLFADSLEIH